MGLDIRYIPSKMFQESILDKDTGCALAAGVVKFYKDNARTTPKEVFKITGSPPNYTYVSIGTEVTLNAVGAFDDGLGNDIIPYLYPYDSSGNLELYYCTVESAGAVAQFTRPGFPNLDDRGVAGADINNYIPNGQFLLHRDITEDFVVSREAGEITADITTIAEGGWFFERSSGSTAKDFVFFDRFGSYVDIPSASPRFAIRIKNEIPDGTDTKKMLRITFKDVNKFASATDFYTFSFIGKSDSGAEANVDIQQIKDYGSGGSSTDTIDLTTVTLSTSYKVFNIPFIPGTNSGKTIGSNEDDTISLALSFPTSFVFENSFDNFILTDGDVTIGAFPPTTNAEFTRDTMTYMPVPAYEGQFAHLPIKNGVNGFEYDDSLIGKYLPSSTEDLEIGEHWADGIDQRVADYSSDGIPYRRVYEKWSKNSAIGLSIYGAASSEMEVFPNGAIPTASYQMRAKSAGAVTAAADGAIPTGFTFTPVAPNPYVVDILFLAASALSGGEYWTYQNTNLNNFIVWYEKDGSGSRPVGSPFDYLKVEITAADTAADVANKTARIINGYSIQFPDWRGYFMRITDDMGGSAAGRDPDAASRGDRGDTGVGNVVGTTQSFALEDHDHNFKELTGGGGTIPITGGAEGYPGVPTGLVNAPAQVSTETRSLNRYANLAIKY